MEGFSACDGGVWVDLLEHLGEGVEERPCVAGTEFLVFGISPVCQDCWDLACGDGSAIGGPDHKVMDPAIRETKVTVGLDSTVQFCELGSELTHRTGSELPEISHCKPGMLTPDLNEAREREIVANEDFRASNEASGKGFVVRVPQADNPAMTVVWQGAELGHFENAEVAIAIVADRMGLTEELEANVGELIFHFLDQMPVRERKPGFGCWWCLDVKERVAFNDLTPAMQEHAWMLFLLWSRRENFCLPGAGFVDDVNHGIPFVVVGLGSRAASHVAYDPA